MADTPVDSTPFYDALADDYDLVYADWAASIERQGEALDGLLRRELGIHPSCAEPGRLLDAACGIGTQVLGLAARGWRVTGSDLSPCSVARARREAAARGLEMDLSVADLRQVHDHHGGGFDAVLACDNSLPHLLTDDDLATALGQMRRTLRPGGACVVSVRDYGTLIEAGRLAAPSVHDHGRRRRSGREVVVSQRWSPRPGDGGRLLYDVVMRFEDVGGDARVETPSGRYYAVRIERLLELMAEAGLTDLQGIEGVLHQPVLLGRAR